MREESVCVSRDYQGKTPLHWLAIGDDIATARQLLENEASVNVQDSDGRTPLHFASFKGTPEIIGIFLLHRAAVNIQDTYGNTSLHYAAKSEVLRASSLLLDSGTDTTILNNDGETAFSWVAEHSSAKLIRLFIEHGANVNGECFDAGCGTGLSGLALRKIGVRTVIAFSAVGSLQEHIKPRDFVVPDQIIDRTKGE